MIIVDINLYQISLFLHHLHLLLSFSGFRIDNDELGFVLSSSEPTFGLFQVGT